MNRLDALSKALEDFICFEWKEKQNNYDDKRTEELLNMGNLFNIKSEDFINGNVINNINNNLLSEYDKNYVGNRLFNIILSKTDEYLFIKQREYVIENIHKQSKKSDFTIINENGKYVVDLKTTRVPKTYDFGKYRNNIDEIINDPQGFISLMYEKQSSGRRYGLQNRLFVIYTSEISNSNCNINNIKIKFNDKENIFKNVVETISNKNLIPYHGTNFKNGNEFDVYGIILIIKENTNKELEYKLIENNINQ